LGVGGELGGGGGEGFAEGHGFCGTPLPPAKACKVFETKSLGLDFGAGYGYWGGVRCDLYPVQRIAFVKSG
jgi:hypothetical protein